MRPITPDKNIATVSSKGQVTIPKHLRDELGIATGDELRFLMGPGNRVIITPRNSGLDDLFSSLKSPHERPLTVEELKESAADGWAFGEPDDSEPNGARSNAAEPGSAESRSSEAEGGSADARAE